MAKQWGIAFDTAHQTMTAATQMGIQQFLHHTEKRYKTLQSHLHFPMLNTHFYIEYMSFSTLQSFRGNKCAQMFTNGMGYKLLYPLLGEGVGCFQSTDGGFSTISIYLRSQHQMVQRLYCKGSLVKYKIKQRVSEPYSGWQNGAKAAICEVKRGIKRAMLHTQTHKRMQDDCGQWVATVR